MANCTVKRTAVVTLTLNENEARAVATVLNRVSGNKAELKAVRDVLFSQGITTIPLGDMPETFIKGGLSWNEEVPF